MDTVLFIINNIFMHYRRVWEKHNGPIPRDEKGRSFEIHHINGNREDNRIENLICISVEEHYKIHLEQGDFGAAFRIAQRMEIDPEIKSNLMSQANKIRLEKGDHPFLRADVRAKAQERLVKKIQDKTQGFQNKEVIQKAVLAKKQKYTSEDLSEQVKKGWAHWREKNLDISTRTSQGSKAGADKTRGTGWYHKSTGENLRTHSDDPRILAEGWIKGRFNGKKLSANANYHKLSKTKQTDKK
jgi:hypothetical protein